MPSQRNVLLTGSVPLPDGARVMKTVAEILGARLRRIPDGETGARSKFITFQAPILGAAAQFETRPLGPQSEWGPNGELPPRIIRVRPGAEGAPRFAALGYADAAIESHAIFARLKQEGTIVAGTRFQVGLPTPIGVLGVFMEPAAQKLAEKPYETSLAAELDRICAAIPHHELAIQWDIPEEVAVWEGCSDVYFDNAERGVVERLARLANRVPSGVELGLHVCYGDISHKHFKEPDARVVAGLVNAIRARLNRPIDYIHMPVPPHWTEERYFAPLREMNLDPATEIYFGLVHRTDGVDGARKRMAAASRIVPRFGVAASCGLGRRPPEQIGEILRLHAAIADL